MTVPSDSSIMVPMPLGAAWANLVQVPVGTKRDSSVSRTGGRSERRFFGFRRGGRRNQLETCSYVRPNDNTLMQVLPKTEFASSPRPRGARPFGARRPPLEAPGLAVPTDSARASRLSHQYGLGHHPGE